MEKVSKIQQGQALYIERYPDRMHPSHRIFQRICKKLRETGSLTGSENLIVEKECVMKTTPLQQ